MRRRILRWAIEAVAGLMLLVVVALWQQSYRSSDFFLIRWGHNGAALETEVGSLGIMCELGGLPYRELTFHHNRRAAASSSPGDFNSFETHFYLGGVILARKHIGGGTRSIVAAPCWLAELVHALEGLA